MARSSILYRVFRGPVIKRRNNMSEASEELKRIAAALEEILRLVKQDQEKFQKINEKN